MELQVSHCVCTEISQKGILRCKEVGNRTDTEATLQLVWSDFIGSRGMPNHIHMLVEIPPKHSVSSFMGYLKGKSSIMIYNKWGNMKYKYRNRSFGCRGYYVDTVGKNTKAITEYIQHQLEEDRMAGQLTLDDSDPFNG